MGKIRTIENYNTTEIERFWLMLCRTVATAFSTIKMLICGYGVYSVNEVDFAEEIEEAKKTLDTVVNGNNFANDVEAANEALEDAANIEVNGVISSLAGDNGQAVEELAIRKMVIEGGSVSASDASKLDWGIANTLNNTIFSIIQVIGIGVMAFGIYHLGISMPSHDATQRISGVTYIAAGILIFSSKSILQTIGVI